MTQKSCERAPKILVTNDDGVDSEGLLALAKSLTDLGDVSVIAPDHNWSAAGHTKTMHKPLRVTQRQLRNGMAAFATNGAPSDCVALAALGFLDHAPDLVVAGINQGSNMGHDVTYSGTVSAAMEGAVTEIPSMAISLCGDSPWNFGEAAAFASSIGGRILTEGLPPNTFLNVNVPQGQVEGVEVTCLGHRVYRDALIKRRDPRGSSYYWIGGDAPTGLSEEGTDVWAISRGCISVTPLQLDMTSYALLDELRAWDLNHTPVPSPAEASSESMQHYNLQGGKS